MAKTLRFLIARPTKLINENKNPTQNWPTSKSWDEIRALDQLQTFPRVQKSFTFNLSQWKEIFDAADASKRRLPDGWVTNSLFSRDFSFFIH
jgi:hypothetical protein